MERGPVPGRVVAGRHRGEDGAQVVGHGGHVDVDRKWCHGCLRRNAGPERSHGSLKTGLRRALFALELSVILQSCRFPNPCGTLKIVE